MQKAMLWLKRFRREDSGQDLVEYALLLVLVALVIAAAFPPITSAITAAFTKTASCIGGNCTQ